MKKYIIAEILLFLTTIFLLYNAISKIDLIISNFNNYRYNSSIQKLDLANLYKRAGINGIILCCLSFIAAISNLTVSILIFSNIKPLFVDYINTFSDRRTARAEQKAERDKAAKQAKIAELQSQLEELKKDE